MAFNKTVRVYNDNKHEHTEKFKGSTISIPPGGYVEMTRDDAVLFRGQFKPMMRNKGGKEDPRGFKMIRIDDTPYSPEQMVKDVVKENEDKNTCQACGFVAASAAGLSAHIRHNHQHQMVDDDAREALAKEL